MKLLTVGDPCAPSVTAIIPTAGTCSARVPPRCTSGTFGKLLGYPLRDGGARDPIRLTFTLCICRMRPLACVDALEAENARALHQPVAANEPTWAQRDPLRPARDAVGQALDGPSPNLAEGSIGLPGTVMFG